MDPVKINRLFVIVNVPLSIDVISSWDTLLDVPLPNLNEIPLAILIVGPAYPPTDVRTARGSFKVMFGKTSTASSALFKITGQSLVGRFTLFSYNCCAKNSRSFWGELGVLLLSNRLFPHFIQKCAFSSLICPQFKHFIVMI